MKKLIALGTGHGVNDCIAGYILGILLYLRISVMEIGIAILMYNVLAFGGQMLFAYLIRNYYRPALFLKICFILLAVSLLIFHLDFRIAIVMVGVASAIIHVIGGYESSRDSARAYGLGIFASPGVLGLVIGGYLAWINFDLRLPGIATCALLFVLISYLKFEPAAPAENAKEEVHFDRHDLVMIVLLTIISLRSAVWNAFQFFYENNFEALIALAIAALAGKLAGGFLSDRIGHKRYTLIALSLSIPFLTVMKQNIVTLCSGVFLLQSTFPVTARMLLNKTKYSNPMGVAFAFGLPILLGAVLFYSPVRRFMTSEIAVFALIAVSIVLVLLLSRVNKFSGSKLSSPNSGKYPTTSKSGDHFS